MTRETTTNAKADTRAQGLLMQFRDRATEDAFREEYVLRKGNLIALTAFAAGVLFYVFFIWDRIIDEGHYEITQAIRGLIFAPAAVAIAALVQWPATRRFTELWLTILYLMGAILLCVIYVILENGWEVGSVGLVLVCFFVGNMFDIRLPYYLVGGLVCIAAMNIAMAVDGTSIISGQSLVNNLCLVSAVLFTLVGAGYREHDARRNFKLQRALSTAETRVGDLEYAIRHAAGQTNKRRVFISYRRQDSEAISGRIRDRLAAHFGADHVFMDIDNIPIGADYRSHIRDVIAGSDAIIPVIGPEWIGAKTGGSFRIDEPADPIRMELELAFDDGVPVLPVLIGTTVMPGPEQLPLSLSALSYLNAAQVDPGRDFHIHLDRLIEAIGRTKVRA